MAMEEHPGPAIMALRKRRGWSRPRLAKAADCSYSHLYNVETKRRVPSDELLARIADELVNDAALNFSVSVRRALGLAEEAA